MKTWFIVPVLGIAIAAMGCTKETPATDAPPMANDLRAPAAPRAPVAKGGIPDDSIKPVVIAPIAPIAPVGKGGIPDDSIKPILNPKGGVPDDSVKPLAPIMPKPVLTPR